MDTTQPAAEVQPWRRRFFTIWVSQAISHFGSHIVGFALIWWLTSTTNSAVMLSIASIAELAPNIVLGPFVGALVDRWDRRRTMIIADTAVALFGLLLVLGAWLNLLRPWQVFVIIFVRALGGVFHFSAMRASTTLLVPPSQYTRIAGLNSTLDGLVIVAAPPVGALLYAILVLPAVLVVDVITALPAVIILLFVAIPRPVRADAGQAVTVRRVLADVGAGFSYLRHLRGLFLIVILATLGRTLLEPAFRLLPILVTRHFHGGALELGWFESAYGVGAIVGGMLLGAWGGFRRRIFTWMAGLIGVGLGCLLIGFSPTQMFWLVVGAGAWLGVTMAFTNVPLIAIIQQIIPPEMQGRVFTLLVSMGTALAPLGLVVAGMLADRLSVQVWFVAAGLGCIAMALIAISSRHVRQLEQYAGRAERRLANTF